MQRRLGLGWLLLYVAIAAVLLDGTRSVHHRSLADLSWYLLFLQWALLAFCWGFRHFTTFEVRSLKTAFQSAQIQVVIMLMFGVLFPLLLTGFFYRGFFFALFAFLEITSLLQLCCYIRVTPEHLWKRVFLVAYEITQPRLTVWILAGIMPWLFYLAAGTVIYIAYSRSQTALYPFVYLTLSYLFVALSVTLYYWATCLRSPQLDDHVRSALLAALSVAFIPCVIFITMLIGLLGWGEHQIELPSFNVRFPTVPALVIAGAYLALLIVPYFIGCVRRQQGEIAKCEKLLKWADRVLHAIELEDSKPSALTELQREWQDERNVFSKGGSRDAEFLSQCEKMRAIEPNEPKARRLKAALPLADREDLRFAYTNSMEELCLKLGAIIRAYNAASHEPNPAVTYASLGALYTRHISRLRSDYVREISKAEDRKLFGSVATALVSTALSAPALANVATFAATLMQRVVK